MNTMPAFLDFEASSLSLDSYPIEVAWNHEDGSIEDHLISPAHIESWTDWDPEAERIHGIKREEILSRGESPLVICKIMNDQLAGKTVYTDAPQFDGMWLSKLFSAPVNARPEFELRHIDELLVQSICPKAPGRMEGLTKIGALKQEARRQKPSQHRAGWDVEYLVQVWRLAESEAETP